MLTRRGELVKLAVVFPGWGTPKSLYAKLELTADKRLVITDFNLKHLQEKIADYNPDQLIFIGWSLGTIRAVQYLENFSVDELILLAPTLYFLENQPEVIMKKMKRDIKIDKLDTLIKFTKENFYNSAKCKDYLQKYKKELSNLKEDNLVAGLDYLLEKDLTDLTVEQSIELLIIVGDRDQVIKNSSFKRVLAKFNVGDYISLANAGHNLIYEQTDKINRLIKEKGVNLQ
jgi:hypothetical protein